MRVLTLWGPVVALFAVILMTLPLGPSVGMVLKRLGPSHTTVSVPLPSSAVQIATSGGLTAVRLADDRLVLYSGGALIQTDARCTDIEVHSSEVLCAGAMGLRRVSATGSTTEMLVIDDDAVAVTRVGRTVVLATASGDLVTASVEDDGLRTQGRVAGAAVSTVRLVPADGAVIVTHADGTVTGVVLSDAAHPKVVGTSKLADAAYDVATFGNYGLLAAGPEGVVRFDITNLGAATVVGRLPMGDVRDVHVSDGILTWGIADGAHAVVNTLMGPVWLQSPHGVEADITALAGRPPQLMALADDELRVVDALPSNEQLIFGVGVLAVLGMVALLGPIVLRRREGWPSKLLWTVSGVVALSWLLVARYDNPIEALHILEYGALGALMIRAVRPVGGGLSAWLLVVVLGASAGLFDETVQFLLPHRSGDIDDVWLDVQAAAIGALVGLQAWTAPRRASWAVPAYLGAVLVVCIGLFQHVTVGYGYAHSLGEITFTSRLTLDQIRRIDAERGVDNAQILERTAALGPGLFLRAFPARVAPFLYELRVHLYRRDRRLDQGDVAVACGEQRLLTQLFARSFAGTWWEWSDTMQARCEPFKDVPYSSPVSEEIMTRATPFTLWGGVGLGAVFLIGMGVRFRRREQDALSV